MNRKSGAAAVALLVGGMVLGGTVFSAQVADAAALLQVRVTNTAADAVPVAPQGTAKVAQQGTADVNVTNGSLDVKVPPPAAVTSGGQRLQVDAGQTSPLGLDITASVLVVQFRNTASEVLFFNDGSIVARFPAPGPLVLPLSQPISFDAIRCGGSPVTDSCDVGWAGSAG